MNKFLIALALLFACFPAQALDRERRDKIQEEVQARDVAQYLGVFENYFNYGSVSSIEAARSVVDSANALTGKYPTVAQLYQFLTELLDSGYYPEGGPMLLSNMHSSLRIMQEKGFGSGKLGKWQFKQMRGVCNRLENVYHTTVKHSAKDLPFGFSLSAGYGYVDAKTLNSKVLDSSCH